MGGGRDSDALLEGGEGWARVTHASGQIMVRERERVTERRKRSGLAGVSSKGRIAALVRRRSLGSESAL